MLPSSKNQHAIANKVRARRKHGGFTLVEVMLAATVLIFGLCSCFGVIQQSFSSLDTARNSTLAAQVMQSEIERLRMMNFTALAALTGNDQPVDIPNAFSTSAQMTNKFTATRTITPSLGRTGMLEIKITVRWNGANGMPHTRSFMTRYSDKGLYDYFYASRQ